MAGDQNTEYKGTKADWMVNTVGVFMVDLDSINQGVGLICGVVDHILSEIKL